ncbi:CRISPR-associated protein cas6/cse3/case, subtype I-e [Firmicutes bacterium M10-2]|nr:CRISPR-associated protein cas6/cse3/case, subtype I-e [Firmicutes bacterium M10-2]
MILSRLELNTNKYKTNKALINPNVFHGAIQNALSDEIYERKKSLWRIDEVYGKKYLLILSKDPFKDPKKLEDQFGSTNKKLETKDFDVFLNKLENGGEWHFHLKANPVYREIDPKKKNHPYRQCYSAEKQVEWLEKRSDTNGFKIIEVMPVKKENIRFKKSDKNTVTMISVTFEGTLKVIDKEKFINILENGLGHGKAYGMGMMSIAKIRS